MMGFRLDMSLRARYRVATAKETTASHETKKEKFVSTHAPSAQVCVELSANRKYRVCRHMNLLRDGATGEASPNSPRISEIARNAASRHDDAGCGFAAQVAAEKTVHDKSIHPRRKDIFGDRIC
jgi:hypothetical protein